MERLSIDPQLKRTHSGFWDQDIGIKKNPLVDIEIKISALKIPTVNIEIKISVLKVIIVDIEINTSLLKKYP